MVTKSYKLGPRGNARITLGLRDLELEYAFFKRMQKVGIAKGFFGAYLHEKFLANPAVPWPALQTCENDMEALKMAKREHMNLKDEI